MKAVQQLVQDHELARILNDVLASRERGALLCSIKQVWVVTDLRYMNNGL